MMLTYRGDASTRDPQTGAPKPFPAQPTFYDVAFSPDGRLVAAGRDDRMLAVWDVETGKRICDLALEHRPYCIAFTPRSTLLTLCFRSKLVEEWSVPEGERLRAVKRKRLPGTCGAFSPDGRHALISSGAKEIAVFDLANGEERPAFESPHPVSGIAFSPSGRWVAAGQLLGSCTVWEFESQRASFTVRAGKNGGEGRASFSRDESLLASGASDGSITVWRSEDGSLVRTVRRADGVGQSVAFHPSGKYLLAVGSGRLSVLEIASGAERKIDPLHSWSAHFVAVAPDGRHAATGGMDTDVFLWSLEAHGSGPRPGDESGRE